MANLGQDFRFGWRTLRKNPGFAAVAVLVLALGIGANAAIFSVVNAVLLQPLPFDQPDRLVSLYHIPPPASFPGMSLFAVSPANFLDWRAQAHSFDGMSAYGFGRYTMTGKGRPEVVRMVAVTDGFFAVMHAQPLLGRAFVEGEDQAGRDHEVILSYDTWRDQFAANPAIVGSNIQLNDQAYTVVGVMPRGFEYPVYPGYRPQMWKPQNWTAQERAIRDNHNYGVIARVKSGVTLEQAKAELATISDRLAQQYPKDDKGWGATAIPLRDDLVGDVRPALLILLGAVALVLLIACANVANLVLAKMLSRRREVAIRSALGASRRRLLQQVLAETVLISLAGGLLGLIFAHYGGVFIVKFAGQQLPRATGIGLDGWVLGFTLTISLVTGIVSGLVPALRLTREDIGEALKQSATRTVSEAGGGRTRSILIVAEVALSLMLLIGAGLLIRSLWMLRGVNPGFDPDHVITMFLSIPSTKFATPQQQISFYDRVLQRVRALPGVQSAGVIDALPLTGGGSHQPVQIEGRPLLAMADQPEVDVRLISPGYVSAMHIPLLRGRDFNDSDVAGRPGAVLISQSMAKQFWPNEDPIGKRLTMYFFPETIREVAGVVADVKDDALSQTRSASMLYMPLGQISAGRDGGWHSFGMTLAVRTHIDPRSTVSAISNAVNGVDSEIPLLFVRTMQDTVDESLLQQRFTMLLLSGFAGLALLLAAVGIYSVLSYAVRWRVREIGIRMALGAQISDVLRMVVVEGMKPTLLGVVIGLVGALALGRVLSSVIYGVSARDLATFSTVAVTMTAVGLLASMVPALRATRVDPMNTLREE
ncbi:MAG TPA: ABC transporter permease [Terriglobales bacterium]|jgi:predicted permease|nr:ABC transporter permease [Terriglobales bacterium]